MRAFFLTFFLVYGIINGTCLASSEISQFWKSLEFVDLDGNSINAELLPDPAGDKGVYWLGNFVVHYEHEVWSITESEKKRLVFPILSEVRLFRSFGIYHIIVGVNIPIIGYVKDDGSVYEPEKRLVAVYLFKGKGKGTFYLQEDGHDILTREFKILEPKN